VTLTVQQAYSNKQQFIMESPHASLVAVMETYTNTLNSLMSV